VKARLAQILIAATIALSCSGAENRDPSVPIHADELRAQSAFQTLRRRWDDATAESRSGLMISLAKFESSFSTDPTVRTARAMRSLLSMLSGDLETTRKLGDEVLKGDPGATRDMATVAIGGARRRQGHPEETEKMLKPLHNKIVDPKTRTILNTELALSAAQLGHHRDAVLYARSLVTQADNADSAEAQKTATAIFQAAPAPALRDLLSKTPESQREPRELYMLLASRLAEVAEQTKDAALARFLLDDARDLLGDRSESLARILTRDRKVRIEQNTIGLLVPLRRPDLERRGIEAAQGLTYAVGLPGSEAKLVTRDDGGDVKRVEESLALLSGDGAAVIVAGFDREEATIAKDFAERTGIAVVLLSEADTSPSNDGAAFQLGASSRDARAALASALRARKKSLIALVRGSRNAVEDANTYVAIQPCGATPEFLSNARADAVIVDGDESCARPFATLGPKVTVALTFDAPGSLGSIHVDAGTFTTDRLRATGALAAYYDLGRPPPSYWTAIGHDAGALAFSAVRKLKPSESDDAATVAERKREVVRLLAQAKEELWTTEAQGFGSTRLIARTIRTRERN
jgi:hypothetical protein